MYKNKDKALDIAERHTKAPRWALEKAYEVFMEDKIWAVNAGLPTKTMEWTNDLNVKLGAYEKAKPALSEVMDLSIAQEALKSLGGAMGSPFDPEH
jgi:hypothetical protein